MEKSGGKTTRKGKGRGKGGALNLFESVEIGIVMKMPVRPKKNKIKPGKVREEIKRAVSNKIPEVMVKVKRGGKSAQHLMAHLEYITRNGKLEAETERGEKINGKAELKEVFKEWTSDAESVKAGARNSINAILSMPPGTDPEGVRRAVREFARQELANYQYMFVLHTDEPHPHCHVSIKTLGFDGKKLDPRKDDLQHWREVFAEKLREQKIPAKATPRTTRGVVEKSLSMAHYKAKHWEQEQAAAAARTKPLTIRDIPSQVFDAVIERGITSYDEFKTLLTEFGNVQTRDTGKPTEHFNVRPHGAGKGANLKDFVFTREFIELPSEKKAAALERHLQQPQQKGVTQHGTAERIAYRRSLERIRNNLQSAGADLQAARGSARNLDQGARFIAHRSALRALAAVIHGRSGNQAESRTPPAVTLTAPVHDRIAQERILGRIRENLRDAGEDIARAQSSAQHLDRVPQYLSDRSALRAMVTVMRSRGAGAPKTGKEIFTEYADSLRGPRKPVDHQMKPRSERDIYTFVARLESAVRATAGEPLKWESGKPMKKDPIGEQIRIREAWTKIAAALRDTGMDEDKSLANDIDEFVANMPPPQTQHQRLVAQFSAMRQANLAKRQPIPTPAPIAQPKPPVRVEPERGPDEHDKGRGR